MSIARQHLPSPLGLADGHPLAHAVARLRRRVSAGHANPGAPGDLAAAIAQSSGQAEAAGAEAYRDQLHVALNAFHHIGGLVPEDLSDEDRERLQLLDAVIARVHAAERAVFVTHCSQDPDSRRAHHEELLRRLNDGAVRPAPAAVPRADPIGRIADGEAVALRLRIRRLSPAGLVALGQLLHFEAGVAIEEEPADGSVALDADDPWVAVG